MKIHLTFTVVIFICRYEYTDAQTSELQPLRQTFRLLRDAFLNIVTPSSENEQNLRLAEKIHILQPILDDAVRFPCPLNNTRSKQRPLTVHTLKPGDIDIVGALGDSLVAGNGLVATNILHIGIQNRGISFAAGGQGTWRQYLTLPNILKEFNPNLIGYSLRDSFVHHSSSQFNVAEGAAVSSDMPSMARELLRRIKKDPRVNITQDWKMISLMIGDNDFCSLMCTHKNPEVILENHRKDLTRVLRILRDNLPRTVVNIILVPHLEIFRTVTNANKPPLCHITQNVLCPCMFGLQYQRDNEKYNKIMTNWQNIEVEVANSSEFDTDDFAVVVQPFTVGYKLAQTKEGLTDYSMFSQDCFHLSQKEGARAALSLWNNLMEPVGGKSAVPSELFHFKCPSAEYPYIFTRRNSFD